MDSKVAEEHGNTETEEGTVALQKKRSRRVSFAEITSVHVFDRDEDYETPPDSKLNSDNPELGQSSLDLGFLRVSTYGNDSKHSSPNGEEDDYDDEELNARRSFLRPIESPSPGSTIGSATSNDEYNFFGPVSASFIRPGRLSDSAASDENHDITMDSTAFSMHFRSLARSDSGGDSKTPTRAHLSFEERTPTQNTVSTNIGSSMVLTVAKKPLSQSNMPVGKLSGGSDSNDMSLVGENPHKYDYGRLSPGLDALLAEGSKDLHTVPSSYNITISKSPINIESKFSPSKKHESDPIELNGGKDEKIGLCDDHDMAVEVVSLAHTKFGMANGGSKNSPVCQITCGFSANKYEAPASDVSIGRKNWSPNQSIKDLPLCKIKESVKDAFEKRMPHLDFSAANSGTISNLDNKVPRLHVFAQNEHESPLAGPISSFSAKQRQIFLNSPSPSKLNATPSQKQSGSFVRDESRKHGESVSSIQKSISKLKMLEASPFSSTLKAKIDSKLISSDYLFKIPPFDTVLEKNCKDTQAKHMDASVACFEEPLSNVPQKNEEQRSTINMNSNGIEISMNIVDGNHTEGSAGLVNGGKSPYHMSTGALCRDKPIELMAAAASPPQFTWSGKKTQRRLLTLEDPTAGTVVSSRTDSSLVEITLDYIKDMKEAGTPHKFVPSPEKRLQNKSLTSPEYKGSLSRNLRLHNQYNKFISFGPGQDADSNDNVTNSRPAVKMDMDFVFMEKAQSSSPFTEFNHSKDFSGVEMADGREFKLHDLQEEPGITGNCQTPLMDRETQKFQSKISDRNLQTRKDPVSVSEDLPGEIKASSCGSASPFVCRGGNEPSIQKNQVEWITQSPIGKELCNAMRNDNMNSFFVEYVPSPDSNQLTDGFESFSAQKRRREEMIHRDGDHLDEISRNQKSPKLHKDESCDSEFLLEQQYICNGETSMIQRDRRLKHWIDVLSKFSGDMKQLLSPLVDKLTFQAIGVLEDITVHLQRLKIYELLCTDIRSQKTLDHLSNLQQKRVAETRVLLHRIVLEQAKLQLMCVKREILLKKVQLVSSGIHECQMLKLNSLPCPSIPLARDAQVDNLLQYFSADFKGQNEVTYDELTTMRHVLEASDRKISNLTKSFHTCCKMKGERSCADTIVLVNDELKKRTCCRFLRLDLQLWEIDNLESRSGHLNIVLNYLGFIIQRFTINVGPVSSIVISNKLNEISIVKNFPSMDACAAFAFLLNADTVQKYVGPRSLTQETQITSSLLGNLLDVVEEVQLARVELRNLTLTSFHSPSVGQLNLQLCFFDFKSNRKVMLTLDMSCLNRGVYPSKMIPSELEAPADVSQKLLPQPLLAEIGAAVQCLRVGYLRIIRLCRCVSQVVEAWCG